MHLNFEKNYSWQKLVQLAKANSKYQSKPAFLAFEKTTCITFTCHVMFSQIRCRSYYGIINFPRWEGTLTVRCSTYVQINTMPLITVIHSLANIKKSRKRGDTKSVCQQLHAQSIILLQTCSMSMKPMCCIKIPRTYMGVECNHCNNPNHLG